MMSTVLVSRSVPLPSPIKITEEASKINIEKQGIVTILGDEITKVPPSLRRTFSADMSSKNNFLSQNGLFSPMKRIASSEELAPSSIEGQNDQDDLHNMPGHDDIWRAIQSKKPKQLSTDWSSILCEKTNNEITNNIYVHPLVKKSSTLNEKSLEICTESLGSETGSDKIPYKGDSEHLRLKRSDVAISSKGDTEDCKEEEIQQDKNVSKMQTCSYEDVKVAKYNYDPTKKMAPKSFPPPLPSLATKDGPSLHMQSHRTNGRLVVEAFSVPQVDYFQTERLEGRLVLTLFNDQEAMDDRLVDFEEVFDNFEGAHEGETSEDDYEDEEDEEDEEEQESVNENIMNDMKFFMEQNSSSLPTSGMLNVHRSALMMKSLMGLGNRDPTWSNKLNKAVELMEEQVVEELTQPPIPQSLPPQQQVARLLPTKPSSVNNGFFNSYEYFWRNNNNNTTCVDQECSNLKGNSNKVVLAKINQGIQSNDHQENMVLVKGNNGDYLVPFIRGCKENRRSLLYWQPHCIATS